MPKAHLGDFEIYYEIHGSGTPVLLVPGLGGAGSYWLPNLADFAEHFKVIVHDHRGTGQSTHAKIRYSVEQMTDDMIRLMDALGIEKAHLVGHSTVFVGHSGVGKSTLVNALVPGAARAIGHVNEVTGRGRHTSSSTVSLRYVSEAGRGWVIDTPGVRSFGLGHVDPANILRAFSDLAVVAEECPRGCTHLPSAPDCAIIEAVAEGRLGERGAARLDSLQRLLETFAG